MRAAPQVPGLYFTAAPPPPAASPLRSDVAGFVGRTRRGPVGVPVRVEGWRAYLREFGGLAADAVMTYAVRGYFENEGQVAHVIRICCPTARRAKARWKVGSADKGGEWAEDSPAGFEHTGYQIRAVSPGAWANDTRVSINYRRRGASGSPELDFVISVPGERVEYFAGVPLHPDRAQREERQSNTFGRLVTIGSQFIQLAPKGPRLHPRAPAEGPHAMSWELTLSGGRDARPGESPGKRPYMSAVTQLGDIGEVALVAVPGLYDDIRGTPDSAAEQQEVLAALIEQAEHLRDRLVLVDVRTDDERAAGGLAIKEVEKTLAWVDSLRRAAGDRAARAAAVYHPRLTIQDPLGDLRHPLRNVPPSGHVAGVISRLDRQRGAHHTPANAEIFGAVDVTQGFDPLAQERLNMTGVNLLRCTKGSGLLVWGGRTLHLDAERRFVVYRRLIHRLVRAIRRVAEPLVFENNGPELWLALARSVTTVLLEAWRAGALKGARQDEAFRVRCDEKLNPPEERELGRVLCEVEVAPAAPMEFIQLRVSLSGEGRLEVFEA